MKTALFALVVILLALPGTASSAVFQYAVPVTTNKGQSTAFLWIPPKAPRIRGIVIGGMTLMEREMAKDPIIREACAAEQLAIVFLKCGLGRVDLQKLFGDLAKVSGYRELPAAPLMFVGHSAGGPPAKDLATKMHTRCFGLVQYRGGTPGGDKPVSPGIPALMMLGQFDEFGGTMRDKSGRETWEGGRDALIAFRAQHEGHLGSIVVEPGAGHFAWSARNAEYLSLFIRKAAQARIPAEPAGNGENPVDLLDIDFLSGWLTDPTIGAASRFKPAPYDEYQGDKTKASWHFDKEMAQATVAYHAEGLGKKDQFIKWNDPHWVDAGARFFFTRLTWVGDGQTLKVHPAYADTYPSQHGGRGPRWPNAGKSVGHSTGPIRVRRVSGPVIATGPDTLRMKYDNLTPADERSRVTFLAYSTGDAKYRYTEQVGMMPRGFRGMTKGTDQTITFPPIGKLKANGGPVRLKAISDSSLPVEYYVACGPATIDRGKLKIVELPARATFPIAVKVVAYQFGRGVKPLVKTAAPVEQTVRIERP